MDFSVARHNMVENQIRTNRVTDPRLIAALDAVPRELFVPEPFGAVAYVDGEIDFGGGRRLIEPLVFARMVQAAEIQPNEIVLDVGCATGYSAAVLSRLASTVVALESDTALSARAGALLTRLGVDNVALVSGPLADGDPAHGPYDVIIVEGAVGRLPDALKQQLAPGGRLLAVMNRPLALGRATITMRVADVLSTRPLFEAKATVLPGFTAPAEFVF